MPTIPYEPAGQPRPEPHLHRQVAESFGVDAARYDRTRPHYPEAMVARIVAESPGPELLDIGCGTGIEARQFLAAGCRVLGVEPDTRMAEFARATRVPVELGTFETWDPAGREFDAVIAGQAWHWVDPVVGAGKAAAVLRPRGRFAAFWNASEPPAAITDAFITAFQRVLPESPFKVEAMRLGRKGYPALTDRAADGIRTSGLFADPELWRFDWEQSYTRAEWLDVLPTQGGLTRLAPEPLGVVLNEVGAAIDALGGSCTVRYATVVVTATLA
ncbi:methyltransferase domain-containing protein [Nocardia sp. SYP-A9097]|uniref:class I SAM-dependent methyltransferase n=1 Tax=Nocardia sp. SYP-A9097 TaxID=2663237 RepID=UPI00129B629E|nr:class I SAM-dependent methyltransferase [Nocardia sp. SYP-A9097]MRH90230.1 methyltransferase domain-containing protein [Nocardia sp. SYP-A9097]